MRTLEAVKEVPQKPSYADCYQCGCKKRIVDGCGFIVHPHTHPPMFICSEACLESYYQSITKTV